MNRYRPDICGPWGGMVESTQGEFVRVSELRQRLEDGRKGAGDALEVYDYYRGRRDAFKELLAELSSINASSKDVDRKKGLEKVTTK